MTAEDIEIGIEDYENFIELSASLPVARDLQQRLEEEIERRRDLPAWLAAMHRRRIERLDLIVQNLFDAIDRQRKPDV